MIRADDVTVTFRKGMLKGRIHALRGFSLEVKRGDIFALLGPNGAGKSTAMYSFLGLIKPEKGSIEVCGEAPEPGAEIFRRIAYLPEEPHYHLYLTVEEAVSFYGRLYGGSIPAGRVDEAIERVGLAEHRDLRLSKCSKGMKQKAGIAACLLNDPELVFLDEPTRGLDPIIVKEFRDILLEMNRKGATIVINSHVLSEVEMVCNRAAIIDRGRVVAQDDLKNLMEYDEENYVVEFDAVDDLPAFVTPVDGGGLERMQGEVPVGDIEAFFAFAGERGVRVLECSLKKKSLEDAFIGALRGKEEDDRSDHGEHQDQP